MLQVGMTSEKMIGVSRNDENLVQQLLDLLELLVCQSSRVDASDLPSKVLKLGRVRSAWEGKRENFDGHCNFAGSDSLGRKRDTESVRTSPRSVYETPRSHAQRRFISTH